MGDRPQSRHFAYLDGIGAREAWQALLWVIAGGVVVRLLLAFSTYGYQFDMDSLVAVRDQLADDPLHLYSALNVPLDLQSFDMQYRWPYPPAFLGFAWLADQGSSLGLPYHGLVQTPAILADAAIAALCFDFLRRRGAEPRTCLVAGGLIMVAPPMLITSGYHGQIDSLAFLPAVLAVYLWDREDIWAGRGDLARPLTVGLLIGIGASIKFVPLILLAAFFPFVFRSPRRAVALVAPAFAVPLVLFAPFLAVDGGGVVGAIGYSGSPGAGGVSMLAQPEIMQFRLGDDLGNVTFNGASAFFYEHGGQIALLGLAAAALVLVLKRPEPVMGVLLMIVAMYVFAPNNYLHYVSWCLPFLLMAGYLRIAAAISAWMLLPSAIAYWLLDPGMATQYVAMMAVLYAGWIALGVMLLSAVWSGRPSPSASLAVRRSGRRPTPASLPVWRRRASSPAR